MDTFFQLLWQWVCKSINNKQKNKTHTMDLLIAVLMYLGVFASPEKLTNEEFLKTNEASINKASEMIESGKACERTGIVVVSGGI